MTLPYSKEEQERRRKLITENIDRFAKEHGWTKRKPLTHCPYCGHKLASKKKDEELEI